MIDVIANILKEDAIVEDDSSKKKQEIIEAIERTELVKIDYLKDDDKTATPKDIEEVRNFVNRIVDLKMKGKVSDDKISETKHAFCTGLDKFAKDAKSKMFYATRNTLYHRYVSFLENDITYRIDMDGKEVNGMKVKAFEMMKDMSVVKILSAGVLSGVISSFEIRDCVERVKTMNGLKTEQVEALIKELEKVKEIKI